MFELYKQNVDTRIEMLADKKAQVDYLFTMAADREDNCLMNGVAFTEAPRIFDRKITSNAVQTLICEVINETDHFEAGDILEYDGDKWLCTSSYVFHNNLYCRGNFYRCNYKLRWQKTDGTIVERWVVSQDASSYSSGVEGNKVLQYGADQQMIWISCDEESLAIHRDKRFFLDNCTDQPTPYILTRVDTTTRTVVGTGYCIWILGESQYDDKKDNIAEMLCDYIEPDTPSGNFEITYYGKPQLRIGAKNKSFTANTQNNVTWSLNATAEVRSKLTMTVNGNTCLIKCEFDEGLIGSSFKLIATAGQNTGEQTIEIIGGV